MTSPDTARALQRNQTVIWSSAAGLLAIVVLWGATLSHDPLAGMIQSDKVRHVMAFGAIGLCTGLLPTHVSRLIGLGAVLALAVGVEVVQMPVPGRQASLADLVASGIGGVTGFAASAGAVWIWTGLSVRAPR